MQNKPIVKMKKMDFLASGLVVMKSALSTLHNKEVESEWTPRANNYKNETEKMSEQLSLNCDQKSKSLSTIMEQAKKRDQDVWAPKRKRQPRKRLKWKLKRRNEKQDD